MLPGDPIFGLCGVAAAGESDDPASAQAQLARVNEALDLATSEDERNALQALARELRARTEVV